MVLFGELKSVWSKFIGLTHTDTHTLANEHTISANGHGQPHLFGQLLHGGFDVLLEGCISRLERSVSVALQEIARSLGVSILFWQTRWISWGEFKFKVWMLRQPSVKRDEKNIQNHNEGVHGYVLMALLFGGWTDVNFVLFTARFEFVGNCHVVSEQAIAWHFPSDHSGQYSASMDANSHLGGKSVCEEIN